MPKIAKVLTPNAIAAARCPKGKTNVDITDGHTPCLFLRTTSKQVKSWWVKFELPGQDGYKKMAFANVNVTDSATIEGSLAWARTEARRLLDMAQRGEDPRQEGEKIAAARAAAIAAADPTLPRNWNMRTLLAHYYEERLLAKGDDADLVAAAPAQAPSAALAALAAMGCQMTKVKAEKAKTAGLVARRSANEVRQRLESNVITICGDVLVRDFSLDHWVEILRPIKARGCFVQANRVLSYTKVMMTWAVARRCRNDNPLTVLAKPFQEVAKSRDLSTAEIRQFWRALPTVLAGNESLQRLLKLYLLLGKRNSELCEAKKSEIALEDGVWVWTIPASRVKGQNHTAKHDKVPLTGLALEIVQEALANPHPVYLFPNRNGKLPYNHSTAGNELKAVMGALGMEPFTIHDLRRTVGTQLLAAKNGLGVKKIDKLRVLNHAGELNGTVSDRVYDTNDYIPEKLAVLGPWGQLVANLVSDQPTGAPQLKLVA